MKRKVAVITKNGQAVVMEEDIPEVKEGYAVIKVHASLISPGTEMNLVKQRRKSPEAGAEDTPFGYANAGEIIEVKSKHGELKSGMRVTAMGAGYALHANYAVVPVNLIVPIPDDVSYADAAYACLGATALQSIRRTSPQLGEYGAVLGAGIVGNLAAQFAQLSGARVILWEGMKSRINIAAQCGLMNTVNFKEDDAVKKTQEFCSPYGLDFAVFAFGGEATRTLDQIKQCVKQSPDTHEMGRVVLVGGCTVSLQGGAASGNLNILSSARTGPGYHDPVYETGKDYPSALIQFTTQRNLSEIVKLISEKRLKVSPMTTHVVPLEDVGKMTDILVDTPEKGQGIVLEMKH